MFYLEKLNF